MLEALQQCRQDLKRVPTLTEYLGWTKRPEVKRRPGRRPCSQGPYDRLFGGYFAAVSAAGMYDAKDGTWNGARTTRAGAYRQTDETLLAALREVADRIGRSPTTIEYGLEREIVRKESEDAGRLRTLPSYQAIHRRFGSWDTALVEAGLEPANGRQRQRERPKGRPSLRRIPDETIRAALREAYAEVGDPFTAASYSAWQKRKVAEAEGVERLINRYPSRHTIWTRYPSWAAAVAEALKPAPGDDAEEDGELAT